MRISKRTHFLRAMSIPLLFCGVAVGLVTVQTAIQRHAERASAAAPQAKPMPEERHDTIAGSMASVVDLSEAAGQGDIAARVEIGRRSAQGRGMDKDEASAAAYFRGIISEYENISARDKRSPHVAAAFLEMARLYKTGVPEANIAANSGAGFQPYPSRRQLFRRSDSTVRARQAFDERRRGDEEYTRGGAVAP